MLRSVAFHLGLHLLPWYKCIGCLQNTKGSVRWGGFFIFSFYFFIFYFSFIYFLFFFGGRGVNWSALHSDHRESF